LLAEKSFQAATMDSIASRAGVGKNTIYRRWRSKEELIVDALRDLAPEPTPTAQSDLRALLLDYLHGQEREFADPRIGKLLPGLLGELQTNPEFALVWVDRVVRPRRRAIVDVLSKALERGELREGVDPDVIADLLLGPPFLRLLFPLGLPPVPKRYSEELLETIWRGIAP
jgi:AcrR family transcriptional regulator